MADLEVTKQGAITILTFNRPEARNALSMEMRAVWSKDGRELFYSVFPGALMAMPVEPGPNLQAGVAEPLFEVSAYFGSPVARHWDVSPDGRRLLMIRQTGVATSNGELEIVLILNWFEELKRHVPVP